MGMLSAFPSASGSIASKWQTRRGGSNSGVAYTSLEEGHVVAIPMGAAPQASAPKVQSMGDAVKRTIVAVGAAVAFGVGVWAVKGRTSAMEFFTGYLIEESLSIDNIFVFIMLFDYFKVREKKDLNSERLTRI